MKLKSGTTDQYIYFVGFADTGTNPGTNRMSGYAAKFAVDRARNGAQAVQYTTPTIAAADTGGRMPGVYQLLVDEDTTMTAGNYTEAYVLHINDTGGHIRPITREIELFKSDTGVVSVVDANATAITNLSTKVDTGVPASIDQTDTGLRQYFDRADTGYEILFTSTNTAITNLSTKVDTGVPASIDQTDTGLRVYMDRIDTGLRAAIDNVDTGLGQRVTAVNTAVAVVDTGLGGVSLRVDILDTGIGGVSTAVASVSTAVAVLDTGVRNVTQDVNLTQAMGDTGVVGHIVHAFTDTGAPRANITQVNSVTITGTGDTGVADTWGPA